MRSYCRLQENSPSLYGVPVVICYQSQYANTMTIKASEDHLMKFLEALKLYSEQAAPVGWWWKREHVTEVGYRYYLILFFDGQKGYFNLTDIQNVYGQQWCSVTENQGNYFIPHDYIQQQTPNMPGDHLAILSLTMQSLLKRDIFLRLKFEPSFDHFGMGKLPKVVNFATQGFDFSSSLAFQ